MLADEVNVKPNGCITGPTCEIYFTSAGNGGSVDVTATFQAPATTTTTSTTTTTTTAPPTTTPTTAPRSTTTTTKPHTSTVTTAPKTSTTTSSSSTTTTSTTAPITTTTAAPVSTGADGLTLDSLAVSPGGNVNATGHGCTANVPVELTVDSKPVGHAKSSSKGEFAAPLQTASLAVGQYQVLAHCGPVLAASFDVVLVSQVGQDDSTVVVVIFVILLGLAIFRRRTFGSRKTDA
jgi:cobalamin biosynthesis Mg chelatase CobN